MAILINGNTKVIVQGGTGKQGSIHTKLMYEYGTKIAGIVTPGKGGKKNELGINIYDSVIDLVKEHEVNTSIVFVPPVNTEAAVLESLNAGIKLVIIITEHVPVYDTVKIKKAATKNGATVIGPNTIGVISPGKSKVGIMPADLYGYGHTGVISRSGTLTHEVSAILSSSGLGISTAVDIGGDYVVGTDFVPLIEKFYADEETSSVVLIGEVGGRKEQAVAEFVEKNGLLKPIFAFIAGRFAPESKRMGHAGAIVTGKGSSAKDKIEILESAGIKVASFPDELPKMIKTLK
mgnify:CR=1 FL=1